MTNAPRETTDEAILRLIAALDSLVDGDRAMEQLIAMGPQVAPFLDRFLLASPPRSIALPRCRAVRVLGALGAYLSLVRYFKEYKRPADAAVMFAEDAVRSAAARELARCPSPETFRVLLDATKARATGGLVQTLAQYRWPESVPLLFELLEDDLCREDAKDGLRLVPEPARAYAILLLRRATPLTIDGPAASRRRRATLQLLAEFGIQMSEWPELRGFLEDEDRDCVLAAATLGLSHAPSAERPTIVAAVIQASNNMNWAQETEATELLDKWPQIAREAARSIYAPHESRGEKPNWLSPFWRILHHLLGEEMQAGTRGRQWT